MPLMFTPWLTQTRLAWPVDWSRCFGRDAPLLLEIGFGNGDFLLDLARRRPEANLIGVEISRPSLRKAARKVRRLGLSNVRLVQAGAASFLWTSVAAGAVAGLTANFSDPWPKPGHRHRRLINERFLRLAATRLAADATLDIATDDEDYAAAIAACLVDTPFFESRRPEPFVHHLPNRRPTKYERKALAEGRRCTYFQWRRTRLIAPDDFPVPQEWPMPHIVLDTSLVLDQIATAFEPFHRHVDATLVRFIDLFVATREPALLLEVHLGEPPLDQRLGLVIRQREAGTLLLQLHELGFPRPTRGVHQAIHLLAAWLLTLDPIGQVRHSNLNLAPDD